MDRKPLSDINRGADKRRKPHPLAVPKETKRCVRDSERLGLSRKTSKDFAITVSVGELYEGIREDFLCYFTDIETYCVCIERNQDICVEGADDFRRRSCRRLHSAAVPASISYDVESDWPLRGDIATSSPRPSRSLFGHEGPSEQTQPAADGGCKILAATKGAVHGPLVPSCRVTSAMDIIATNKKGQYLNTLENYHIYRTTKKRTHMNNTNKKLIFQELHTIYTEQHNTTPPPTPTTSTPTTS
ncbi:uncharacterized protein LOC111865748 [Cryptotermes secundus]|uniref:uncharacterized protein LOC111865748 n=1 Tax=Cryptotermes secundus TaxID=105785 RepID=UPI000CD7C36A|nr:uncharacterized protein LOC111865748 [Cryptotermes secundus]